MFVLHAGNLDLVLEMVAVKELLQHERTLHETIKKLVFEFKNWANLQNPIIVDENYIVLDGNHRAGVFKELDFRYIPVCKIDYFHEDVQLKYWLRLVRTLDGFERLLQKIRDRASDIKSFSSKDTLKEHLDRNPLHFGLQRGNSFLAMEPDQEAVHDAVDTYDLVQWVQELIHHRGEQIEFIPCQYMDDDDFYTSLHGSDLVIWTPRITKKMVVEAAKARRIFAPKSTRHLIPARPLNVNVPIQWCDENVDDQEINAKFTSFLKGRQITKFGPGQVINGRFYGESTFVFVDKKK
jgi:hypothetical protein